MPLHDLSYRRHEGPRTSPLAKSWAIARTQFAQLLKRRAFLLLLAASWIPVVARAIQIYGTLQFPQASDFFGVTALTWFQFLTQQIYLLPVILVSLYAGAPAIASDVSSGALLLYLSKPISVRDYVLGKALPILCSIGFVTLLPALFLLGLHLALSGDLQLLRGTPWLPVSILAYSLWLTLYFGLAVLAVSSLSRSGRVAGAGFVALALGSEVVVRGALARLQVGFRTHLPQRHRGGRRFGTPVLRNGRVGQHSPGIRYRHGGGDSRISAGARSALELSRGRILNGIELADVSRWYGSVLGLSRVSLAFSPGVTALLGPNGAGKSTLLKLVTGVLRPSSGAVTVLGESPFANPRTYERLGVVPEEEELQAKASASDWLTYLLRLRGLGPSAAREQAEASLEDVGLGTTGNARVSAFSRGMKQRLRIAQAVAHQPDILVLDEPLTGLDPVGRREVIDLDSALGL